MSNFFQTMTDLSDKVSATNVHWTLCGRTRLETIRAAFINGRIDCGANLARPTVAHLPPAWVGARIDRAQQQSFSQAFV